MIPGSRKNRPSRPFTFLLLLAAAAFAAGCSTSNTEGGGGTSVNHVLPSGSSVAGWTIPSGGSLHAIAATNEFVSNGGKLDSCLECHGADLSGGISNVSCFDNPASCHHGTIPGWDTPQKHGASAKVAPGDGSFFACQICHGITFSGGGSLVSCFTCHTVDAPHPPRPWHDPAGTTHTNTNTLNAPVCALCHYPGSSNNPANHPATPAPGGTPPGCFNNTLCHGAAGAPHPLGNPAWVTTPPAAQPHGNAAKATPGATTGFAYCQICHGNGTNFAGGSSSVSCYPCHGPSAPHPSQWRTGDTYVHTTTAQGNAPVCAFCHSNGANSPIPAPSPPAPAGTPPGCFNSTLCHGAAVHPAGWAQPSQHGSAAKAVPSASGGFSYCQACHGIGTTPPANFNGNPPAVSCYPCHVLNAPHPSSWIGGGAPHRTTDPTTPPGRTSNPAVCFQCHQGSAPVPPAVPGCFNNTLCH